MLFVVTHPDKPGARLSLMGTMHLERSDFRLDRTVERAIDSTDQLFVEIDTTPEVERQLQSETMRLGTLPEGQSVKDQLKPETWALLEKECTRLKLDAARLTQFKPWLLGLMLTVVSLQQANPDMRAELGLDKRVIALVRAKNKPITSLETADFQLGLLSGGDAALQEAQLTSTLKELAAPDKAKALFAAFEEGDLGSLEKLVLDDDDKDAAHEAYMKRFWVDRNLAMFDKLKASFGTPGKQLVAVGMGHLLGDTGLVRQFEKAGYVVERAKTEGPGAPWVAPWLTETGDGFSLSFPGEPTRKVTPLDNAESTVLLWQSGAVAFALEVTRAPTLAKKIATERTAILQSGIDTLAKGRSITKSETVELAGHPALHAIIEGGTPELHIETYAFEASGVVYSLRAVAVGGSGSVPQADFARFFKSFTLK